MPLRQEPIFAPPAESVKKIPRSDVGTSCVWSAGTKTAFGLAVTNCQGGQATVHVHRATPHAPASSVITRYLQYAVERPSRSGPTCRKAKSTPQSFWAGRNIKTSGPTVRRRSATSELLGSGASGRPRAVQVPAAPPTATCPPSVPGLVRSRPAPCQLLVGRWCGTKASSRVLSCRSVRSLKIAPSAKRAASDYRSPTTME